MSAAERAVIYVDSGSDLSSITSVSSMSSSTSVSPLSSSRRGGTKINTSTNAIVPHQEIVKSSKSSNGSSSGNNFVIKIQIGEESTLFNPVRIDVATKNGHLHRIQHHHVTTTTATGSGPGKSILIAAASTSSCPDDDMSPTNSSNSGQSSPRSDMTPPPLGKGVSTRLMGTNLLPLRFGSETSESDTESDISSLTDYQIGRPSPHAPFGKNGAKALGPSQHHNANTTTNGGGKLNQLQPVPSASCPAAQYVMREILGMSLADPNLDNKKKTKLIEEQNKFVQLKDDVHKSLMKTFSNQENKLKPSGVGKPHVNSNRKETFSDEIKKVVQQRLNRNQAKAEAAQSITKNGGGFGVEVKEVAEEKKAAGHGLRDVENDNAARDDGSMIDVMKIVTANNKIVSFTPASASDSSCPIFLDQNYFHLNEIREFNGHDDSKEKKNAKQTGLDDIDGADELKKLKTNRASNRSSNVETLSRNFAGYKEIFARTTKESQNQIMSDNGTIRGVKNRVRDGIATFLQTKDTKNYNEKEKGRLVVYVTSMGVVRDTFQRCQKVKQILRTLLVKFDERDCYMNRSIQDEIRERLQHQNNNNLMIAAAASSSASSPSSSTSEYQNGNGINNKKKLKPEISAGFGSLSTPPQQKQLLNKITKSSTNNAGAASFCTNSSATSSNVNHSNNHNLHNKNNLPINFISLPQVFLEGQHLGDADAIEKLNETGQLRDLLRPFKSLSVLTTCGCCGGFRMLPCPICNGSKKSVHRNHFTTEFVALKCMHCDPAGLVRCEACNAPDDYKGYT